MKSMPIKAYGVGRPGIALFLNRMLKGLYQIRAQRAGRGRQFTREAIEKN